MENRICIKEKARNVINWITIISCLIFLIILATNTYSAQTTGGVNWIDTLGYTKPVFVPLTVPDESAASKYYVDLANGSDSANCTSTSTPCKTMNGLAGKAYSPLRGGGSNGAYVYVKGNGSWSLTTSFYGVSGKEIVIVPWPGDTTTVYTFTASGKRSPNLITGAYGDPSSVQWVIIDGGPNLQFKFRSNGTACTSGDENYDGNVFNGSNNTLDRIQFTGNGTNCQDLMGQASSYTPNTFTNLRIINCEFHDAITAGLGDLNQNYGIYAGGGSACNTSASALVNFYYQNNIFRNLGSLGLQVEPRSGSNGVYISGNAFHDLGIQSCGSKWHCRPAVAVTSSCGGTNTNVNTYNNLIWNIADACIWPFDGGTHFIYNNTCYNYDIGTGDGYDGGIVGYGGNLSGKTIRNNIIYSSGHAAFNGSNYTVQSNNICSSGCAAVWNASTVLSTASTNPNFLKIGSNSNAKDTGATISSVTTGYNGTSRPYQSGFDIGAFEYSPAPSPPTLQIQ